MKLHFTGETEHLEDCISALSNELGFALASDGTEVCVSRGTEGIKVGMGESGAFIEYKEKIQFCRAIGLLVEAIRDEKSEFSIAEATQFEFSGVMVDCSRNAVMNITTIKDFIRKMAVIGLGKLILYMEDIYTVEGYPYFGYMRGRYTPDEIKECDEYAALFGVELVPHIETLAHMERTMRWEFAQRVCDYGDVLLADDEETYKLIEAMIRSISKCFSSKKLHLGLDEAFAMGRGRYLDLHGAADRTELFTKHTNRVIEIAEKYGLGTMMYSDMYVRQGSEKKEPHDEDTVISKELTDMLSENTQLVYWDYMGEGVAHYRKVLNAHKAVGRSPFYCGSAWSFSGSCPDYKKAFSSSSAGLLASKQTGIKGVYVSIWHDGGSETDLYSNLFTLQLYAEHTYRLNPSDDEVKKRLFACTGMDAELCLAIFGIDNVEIEPERRNLELNLSYYVLWQDVLLGFADKNLSRVDLKPHFDKAYQRLKRLGGRCGEYADLWDRYIKLCHVAELKWNIGIRMKNYYDEKNKKALLDLAKVDLPELSARVNALRNSHRSLWYKHNKAFGWEILDIRYGGVMMRIDTAISEITDYLDGKLEKIEELEEERMYMNSLDGKEPCNGMDLPWAGIYFDLVTAGRMN